LIFLADYVVIVHHILLVLLLFFQLAEKFLDLFLKVGFLFFQGIEHFLDSVNLSQILREGKSRLFLVQERVYFFILLAQGLLHLIELLDDTFHCLSK
jgi:hypothetical protein